MSFDMQNLDLDLDLDLDFVHDIFKIHIISL